MLQLQSVHSRQQATSPAAWQIAEAEKQRD
jgi:hypothetical protein